MSCRTRKYPAKHPLSRCKCQQVFPICLVLRCIYPRQKAARSRVRALRLTPDGYFCRIKAPLAILGVLPPQKTSRPQQRSTCSRPSLPRTFLQFVLPTTCSSPTYPALATSRNADASLGAWRCPQQPRSTLHPTPGDLGLVLPSSTLQGNPVSLQQTHPTRYPSLLGFFIQTLPFYKADK